MLSVRGGFLSFVFCQKAEFERCLFFLFVFANMVSLRCGFDLCSAKTLSLRGGLLTFVCQNAQFDMFSYFFLFEGVSFSALFVPLFPLFRFGRPSLP